jgi:hypothetical protein
MTQQLASTSETEKKMKFNSSTSSFLISFFLHFIHIKSDFGIYGRIADSVEVIDSISMKKSYSTCYGGFGYTNCRAKQADDDTILRNTLPYYRSFDLTKGLNYCLQCCSENDEPDVWELECLQYTDVGPKIQVYGYELRMARQLTLTDTEIIRCPIYRSACTYNESDPLQVLVCNGNDKTSLWGIQVEFWITIRSKNFVSWRSVDRCVVTADERTEALPNQADFTENYILYHTRQPQSFSTFDGTIYSLFALTSLSFLLFFFRRDKCIVCDQKLVFCLQRCALCRFYGAHPPDPILLQAMTEKGNYLQGEYPERFPGLKNCLKCVRGIISVGVGTYRCVVYILKGIQLFISCVCCCQCKQCWSSSYCCEGCCHLEAKMSRCWKWCCRCCSQHPAIEPICGDETSKTIGNEAFEPETNVREDDELLPPSTYRTLEEGTTRTGTRRVPVRSRASAATSMVSSSNPTVIGGIKAPKRPKKNPYRIKVDPYFIYKALDHPHPPPAPAWVQHRDLDEYED